MRKLVAFTATTVMTLAGWAEATLTGVDSPPATNYSIIEKVGCVKPGGDVCQWGRHRVCKGMVCWCAPCGGLWHLWPY
jgi:hypothetical protein